MRFFSNNRLPFDRFDGFDRFDSFCGFGGDYFPWGGVIMMFIGIALIGLVIYLIVKNNRLAPSTGVNVPFVEKKKDTDYYVNILKESYAKGELSDEEFERKVRILRENE